MVLICHVLFLCFFSSCITNKSIVEQSAAIISPSPECCSIFIEGDEIPVSWSIPGTALHQIRTFNVLVNDPGVSATTSIFEYVNPGFFSSTSGEPQLASESEPQPASENEPPKKGDLSCNAVRSSLDVGSGEFVYATDCTLSAPSKKPTHRMSLRVSSTGIYNRTVSDTVKFDIMRCPENGVSGESFYKGEVNGSALSIFSAKLFGSPLKDWKIYLSALNDDLIYSVYGDSFCGAKETVIHDLVIVFDIRFASDPDWASALRPFFDRLMRVWLHSKYSKKSQITVALFSSGSWYTVYPLTDDMRFVGKFIREVDFFTPPYEGFATFSQGLSFIEDHVFTKLKKEGEKETNIFDGVIGGDLIVPDRHGRVPWRKGSKRSIVWVNPPDEEISGLTTEEIDKFFARASSFPSHFSLVSQNIPTKAKQ